MASKVRRSGYTSSRDRDIGSPQYADQVISVKAGSQLDGRKQHTTLRSSAFVGDEIKQSALSPINKAMKINSSNHRINPHVLSNDLGSVNPKWGNTTARDVASRLAPSTSPRILPSTAMTSSNAFDDRNLVSVPISPMNIEVSDLVPSWGFSNGDFGGRGATSIPKPRNSSTSDKSLGDINQSFLPGLISPGDADDRLLSRTMLGGRKISETARVGGSKKVVSVPVDLLSRGTGSAAANTRLFVSERASYAVGRTITTEQTSASSSSSPSIPLKSDRATEVEPWAFKIIEKFHAEDFARPHSRCSTRRTVNESSGGPTLHSQNTTHNKSASNLSHHLREKLK